MDYQPGQPTEEELAAGMAAVFAFMETREAEKTTTSNWKQASYLESTAGSFRLSARPTKFKGSLWNVASRLLPIALIFGFSVSAVSSQELRPAIPEAQGNSFSQMLKVGLSLGSDKLDLNTPDGADIIDQATGEIVGSSGPSQKFIVASKRGTLSVSVADATTTSALKPVSYTPNAPQDIDKGWHGVLLGLAGQNGYVVTPKNPDGLVGVNGKLYRGQLLLTPNRSSNDKLNVINLVDLEDYLLSVLPSEMPSQWHPEALKAQAIAARSYAMANLGKHATDGYDVKANTEDQVYTGVAQETEAGNLAVAQTQGIVLKQFGKIITAYFHSGGGGHTEAPESVWGGARSYLQSVPDFDDASPKFSWLQDSSTDALEETLRKNKVDVGSLLNIEILSRSDAMRVQKMLISGSKAARVVSGEQFRRFLALPSTKFNVGVEAGRYVFAGRGFGHGLGLSQWGAKALAENGYNAPQILKYYYKDVMLDYI
ncbi:MAG: SpoIID/LytB domain-containing protein [Candidatus Obscuribacterales bacterium]|nr:SpoIID/LytB domain-containing protein [Candidatus Obscuribacterales bacterium]